MGRIAEEQKLLKHSKLLDDFNEMQIAIKAHLFDIKEIQERYPKPTIQEMDKMNARIRQALEVETYTRIKKR